MCSTAVTQLLGRRRRRRRQDLVHLRLIGSVGVVGASLAPAMSTASRGLTPSVYESGDATEAILDVALAGVPTCRLAEPLPLPESPSDSYGLRVVVGDTPPCSSSGLFVSLGSWSV